MSVIFTIKEETYGRWGIYRGPDLLISQPDVAGAITDARELAQLVHVQSGDAVTVALANADVTIVLACYEKPEPASSEAA